VYILICINYMSRPTVAIIRFITDFKRKSYMWVGVISVINLMMATVGRNM